jgi:MFS family permease
VNGIAAIYFLPESHGHAERSARAQRAEAETLRGWLDAMTRFPLSLLLGIYFLTISSFNAMTAVLALYLHHSFNVQEDAMAVVFTVAGGTTVLVRGVLLGPLVRRFGESVTARIGIVALALSMLIMSIVPNPWTAYATVPIFAFGAGTLFPTLASLVSRATDAGSQGSVLGGSQVVGGLGRVIGPLWAGWLFQNIAPNSPFRVGAMFVLLGGLFSLKIPISRRTPAPVPPTGEEVAPGVTGA